MIKILITIALLCCVCLNLHMAAIKYYPNTKAENYIGVGLAGQSVYFSQITKDPNVIKCPFHKPFTTDGLKCFQCPIETPLFNFQTQRCEICPGGLSTFANHACN
jgi:hypothetical protein